MPKYPEIQFKHILETNALFRLCLYDAKWKAAVTKNQLSGSAAGWSKDHIMLGLTPTDAYTKPGSQIKKNFPILDIDCHPYRGHSYWTRSSGLTQCLMGPILTDGLSETFCLYQDPQLWFSAIWGNPSSCSYFAICIIKEPWRWEILSHSQLKQLKPTWKWLEISEKGGTSVFLIPFQSSTPHK